VGVIVHTPEAAADDRPGAGGKIVARLDRQPAGLGVRALPWPKFGARRPHDRAQADEHGARSTFAPGVVTPAAVG
jgi:hypothetical protein